MIRKIGLGFLTLLLTAAVLLGAYQCLARYQAEQQGKAVELVLDLNDVKTIAAYDKKPLAKVLLEAKKAGISGIGLFEETLPDASALGDLYYAKGSGILRLKNANPALAELAKQGKINPERTYIYVPDQQVRQRVYDQLSWALGAKAVKFLTRETIEVDEAEEELRPLGLGISEQQKRFLEKLGFRVIPRLWNDARYHLGNMEAKISGLKGYDLVIFDGDKIIGYPDAITQLAQALKKFGLRYGYLEIVKQDGDMKLKKLMGDAAVRVHSVPKDELEKLEKPEVLDRFVRAARERSVRVIYLRPFLPPQIDAFPVEYNIKYFQELSAKLTAAGFTLGKTAPPPRLQVAAWQIVLLGTGVMIGTLFLIDAFITLPLWLIYVLLFLGVNVIVLGAQADKIVLLQKGLALLAALVFPSYAVITSLSGTKEPKAPVWAAALLLINVLAETAIGIFLMVGLLADANFMNGIEMFPAVKLELVLPVVIVALYFLLKSGAGSLRDRLKGLLETRVSLWSVLIGLVALAGLGVLVARSGNFVLPVPAFEKYFRNWLEVILFVRPRTKEFLVGYPFLYLAALYHFRGNKLWLWLLAAIGVIAPVSVFNTFSHIHTPLLISAVRTFNGLVLGLIVAIIVGLLAGRFIRAEGTEQK